MSICKGCKREIEWVKMRSGKSMPVDPGPKTISAEEAGRFNLVTQDGGVIGRAPNGATGRMPHWATCPDFKKFKKEKEIKCN